jgi:hypothetical protein
MENLGLFLLTASVYLGVWCLLNRPERLSGYFKRAAVIALLCAPINVNGNVFTVLGNAAAEKNNVSLCSVYQQAGHNAFTVVGPLNYQVAGKSAWTTIGIALYQSAGQGVVTGVGLSGYQSAGQNAVTIAGVAGYQSAGESAVTHGGVAFYQKAGKKTRSFGAFTKLKAE